jgi:hypothetical protein
MWKRGNRLEYKALEYLSRSKNAKLCGVNGVAAQELKNQAKWFDDFSHPSKSALTSVWVPGVGGG